VDQLAIYKALLSQRDLPVNLQTRIFEFSRSTKSVDLLVSLAGYGDLDPKLDTSLRRISNSKVRIAWLKRPGRSQAEITRAVAGEKRVGALTSILESGDLPATVTTQIASVALSRDSAQLALTVLRHGAGLTKTDQRRLVVTALTGLGADNQASSVINYIKAHSELALTAIAVTTRPSDLTGLLPLAGPLSAPTQKRILDELIAPLAENNLYSAITIATLFEQHSALTPATQARLVAVAEQVLARPYSKNAQWELLHRRLTQGGQFKADRAAFLIEALSTNDIDRYRALATLSHQFEDNDLLGALLVNQNIEIVELLTLFTTNNQRRAREHSDAAITAATDAYRLARLVAQVGPYGRAFAAHPLRDAAIDLTLSAAALAEHWVSPNVVRQALDNGWLSTAQLLDLPLSLVLNSPGRVLAHAVAELGGDPAQWELFETFLVDGSTMTLGFAIESAKTLSQ
jgi:hypothetical protein